MSEYVHPKSGRVYREGDPAHRYAQMWQVLMGSAQRLATELRRGKDRDYLERTEVHPERYLEELRKSLDAFEKARVEVVADKVGTVQRWTSPEEWRRKYGRPPVEPGG